MDPLSESPALSAHSTIRSRTMRWKILAALGVVVVIGAVILIWVVMFITGNDDNVPQSATTPTVSDISTMTPTPSTVSWSYNQQQAAWVATGTPPACPSPLVLQTPVDMKNVTSMLYPGQLRGADYKAHGGFRLDGLKNNSVTIRLPLDGYVYRASRYLEDGEVQYLFDLIHPCGIMVRFDHLLVLSPPFADIAETLPEARKDDSRTTSLNEYRYFKAGDLIATAVGHTKGPNVSLDLGVYDLNNRNEISRNTSWANQPQQKQKQEQTYFAVCWFDWLTEPDRTRAKTLPLLGDRVLRSDYCK